MNKRIKAKCHLCDTVGYIPEEYQGKIKCPDCKSVFQRTGNPHSLIRKQLVEKLENLELVGIVKIKWIGGDEHSCDKCKDRSGMIYSIQEMKEILGSEFCNSDPFEQGCRCTIGGCK